MKGSQTMTRDFNRKSSIVNRQSAQSSIVNRKSSEPDPHQQEPQEAERKQQAPDRKKKHKARLVKPARSRSMAGSFTQPVGKQSQPLTPSEEETIVVLVEDYLVTRSEQKSKILYLPIARIASEKDDHAVKSLFP